jgi:demethylmenaquinone methyltransferase / 2-methoxy-6-polyprenyl-1,4-benzoquinol methylase
VRWSSSAPVHRPHPRAPLSLLRQERGARREGFPGAVAVDLATGTGDLALRIAASYPGVKVIGIDPSEGMLAVARRKAAGTRVELRLGDAQAIELDTGSADAVSIAFGIRNVPDRDQALREMARICRPGGRVAILELTEPRGGVMGALARAYIHQVVPRVGGALSGVAEYGYLQRSIAAFPPPEAFADRMASAGLSVIDVIPLFFGVAHLFVGTPSRREVAR